MGWFNEVTLDEMGLGSAERLAGEHPSPSRFGVALWLMRSLLLILLLQILDIASTLRNLRRWSRDPGSRPSRR
jgi:hypothetical protein